jgi:hypothetical protein
MEFLVILLYEEMKWSPHVSALWSKCEYLVVVVNVDGERRCLITAATNGPIVIHDMIYDYGEQRWNERRGETERTREKPVSVPLCPPQMPHGLTRARTRTYALRGR